MSRSGILFDEFIITLEVELAVVEIDLVVGESGLRLVELRLIGARVNPGEHVAFLDRLTFLELTLTSSPVIWL